MFLRLPSWAALPACRVLVALLWPAHRLLWLARTRTAWLDRLRREWVLRSPVVDHHGGYAQIGPALLRTWAVLDTHDALTDRYKHLRRQDEIADALRACGMERIEAASAGNGVEARAWKPARPG